MMKKILLIFGAVLMVFSIKAQAVRGKVTDAANNDPLVGVSVVLKGTNKGTITDIDGNYQLDADRNGTLIFSFVGYKAREVAINGQKDINIALSSDAETLNEVVVVGYGTQKKSDLTGSVSSVKSKEIQSVQTGSVSQALQGRVAGLLVTPASGEPGAGAILRVRGTGTLNNSNPFFVVDGMLLDNIDYLNPNDIESVEVLKDASATAIYGSRGANGVIIITTKKGKSGTPQISLSMYQGTQSLQKKIGLTDATQYATLINEAARNQAVNNGQDPTKVTPTYANPESLGKGTDWQDQIFRDAPMQNANIGVRGGNDKITYSVSGDYFNQKGILKGSEFRRLSLRLNNEYRLNSWLKVGHNISLVDTKGTGSPGGLLYNAYYAAPTVNPLDSVNKYGNTTSPSGVGNPVAQLDYERYNKGNAFRSVGNVYLDFEFIKGLTFRSNFGLDKENSSYKSFRPVFFVTAIQQNQVSRLNSETSQTLSRLWENTVTYSKTFGKHSFTALAGYTAQLYNRTFLNGSATKLLGDANNLDNPKLDDLLYISDAVVQGDRNVTEGSNQWNMASALFRLNYNLSEKYLLTASYRRDGSSKFGPNKRYGNFYAGSVAWRIKEEAFLKDVDWLSNLKIRASWGIIGNEKIEGISNNAAAPPITGGLDAVFGNDEKIQSGGTLITLANPDLHWEETEQIDIGFEAGILNNRLTAEVDYYRRVTNDILLRLPIPKYVGSQDEPVVNAAEVLNRGFDINLGWRDRAGKLNYNIGVIASTVHNEVLSLGEGKTELLGGGVGEGGKLGTRTAVGLPIGAFYGYKVAGVYQNTAQIKSSPKSISDVFAGDLIYADISGNDTINASDRTFLGSAIPNLNYSFNIGADFMGFDFSILFTGIRGNKLLNAKRIARFSTGNFETAFLNRWNGEGTSNFEPRVTIGGRNYEVSERFLEDGAFFAIRNIQIGYTLPQSILSKIKISNFRIYASATNPKTWTKYSGYTPEINRSAIDVLSVGIDSGVYPVARTYTVGLNLTF